MGTIKVDLTNKYGKFKMLNATNGGPIYKRHATDQWRTNITEYKDARIPFSRNHDSNAIAAYGGPYAHDISAIFPNFAADENDAVRLYIAFADNIEAQLIAHLVKFGCARATNSCTRAE